MAKLRPVEGKLLIKIHCNDYGFRTIRQKGSHVTLTCLRKSFLRDRSC